MKQGKIYIIEDDETIVKLLKQHLSQTYEVFSVQNFRAIKQEVEEIQPDLILIDITLPYFNGFYWTTEIRKTMTLPIIFISSSDDEMDTVMALNMGGYDFVSKPFSLTILDAKISAFLRRAYQFTSDTYQLGAFSLSRDGVLSNGTEQISLSPTENKIFIHFIWTPKSSGDQGGIAGKIVGKRQLYRSKHAQRQHGTPA